MAVWSPTIEPHTRQQDLLWALFSRTQQIGCFTGISATAPAPGRLTSWKQALANKGSVRCKSFARRAAGAGDGFSSQGLLWRQFKGDSRGSLLDAAEVGRPAAYEMERVVTADTVSTLCHQGHLAEAVEALGVLVQAECGVARSLFYTVLKKCVLKKDLVRGRRVHAFMVQGGYDSDTFLCNHILRMYSSHGRLQDAMDVFTVVAEPDAFMWSSIISAHVKHGQDKQAVQLYHRMRRSSVKPDGHVFVAALQACAKAGDLKAAQELHGDVLASGVEPDLFVWNCLVDMYAKCGSLEDARRVFDRLVEKDVVTWTSLVAGYAQQGMGQEALRLYRAMREEGIAVPDSVTFVCLLQACASVGASALDTGKQLHTQIRERGYEADVFVANSLVNMYAKCGSLEEAQTVFEGLAHKDVVTWTAMIAGFSRQGMGQEALRLSGAMEDEGIAVSTSMTFVCLLQACASVGIPALEKGKQLHAQIRQQGQQADVYVANSLVNMYAKCGSLEDAQRVFDGLAHKDVVTWTALIAGYSQQGMGHQALHLYSTMKEEGMVVPDCVTFVCLLQACASVGTPALDKGKELHAEIKESGHQADVFVANSLVNMYTKCGSLEDARRVFNALVQKDVVTWNAMIAGYSQQGRGQEALQVYRAMQEEGTALPDSVTFVCLLQACASVGTPALEMGKRLHTQIRDQGYQADVLVANSLVNMYAKCGSLDDAQTLFDGLVQKDVVTWTAMIAGFSQQGMDEEALRLYRAMEADGIAVPNAVTFACLLQACANVAALHLGRELHAQIVEQGLQADIFVAGSLINMYGKSGSMIDARQVFEALPERDVVAWNALIAGYSHQGDSAEVFKMVTRMREDGIQPDGITFLGVLTVCSHTGLVSKGQEFFEAMSSHYGINPTVQHYTCMVDLLGRAGLLDEAVTLVSTMPALPDAAIVWHTLLGACQNWSNVEVGRFAFDQALKLQEKDAAAHVLMSNIYTGAEMWEEAQELQARRISIGAWKQPGQSWWTDTDGVVHSFLVGDKKLPGSQARPKQVVSKMKKPYPHLEDLKRSHVKPLP